MLNGKWFPALVGVQGNVFNCRLIFLIVPFLFLGRGTIFVSKELFDIDEALFIIGFISHVFYFYPIFIIS